MVVPLLNPTDVCNVKNCHLFPKRNGPSTRRAPRPCRVLPTLKHQDLCSIGPRGETFVPSRRHVAERIAPCRHPRTAGDGLSSDAGLTLSARLALLVITASRLSIPASVLRIWIAMRR
jgi:hypothetical protein